MAVNLERHHVAFVAYVSIQARCARRRPPLLAGLLFLHLSSKSILTAAFDFSSTYLQIE